MYIVIAGGGLLGLSLAEALVALRHDVLVIDPDPTVCDYAASEIGVMTYCGSATSTKALEAVGLGRAEIAVAMMRSDADNLAFLLLARSLGVPKRIVKMREAEFEGPYLLAGATTIASAVKPLIDQILLSIEYPEVKGLMRLGTSGIEVFEVRVPEDGLIAGLTVSEIVQTMGIPETCNFVAVEPPGGPLEIARGTTVVPGGANLTVLGMEVDLQKLSRLLTRPGAPALREPA